MSVQAATRAGSHNSQAPHGSHAHPTLQGVAALFVCACAAAAWVGPAQAQSTNGVAAQAPTASASGVPARDQVERRITSTGALLGNSSGAKQIESSGNPDAKIQLLKARELHAQAKAFFDAGDLEGATKMLHAAAKTMMEAVGLASPEQVTARKERNDFDARLESTRALLDAQKRIASEKGAGPRNAELTQRIEALIGEANQLAAAGKLGEARRVLDQGYGAARAAIGGLRGGDTLVRSLNFANKEEEYAYEIDRNDTHRMLITVLLQDKRSASVDAAVDKSLQEAARLRRNAEEQAQRRDHAGAIKTLEDSTRELVRAIRSAGVYIPG